MVAWGLVAAGILSMVAGVLVGLYGLAIEKRTEGSTWVVTAWLVAFGVVLTGIGASLLYAAVKS